jgi:peptidoglycan/xylan/chitin deacetylase (PgdA/CDA1 family)
LAAVIFVSGAYIMQDSLVFPTPQPTVSPPYIPPEPLDPDDLYHAIIEYGVPHVIKHNNDPLYAYIRYPQGDNPTDAFIHDWALDLYNNVAVSYGGLGNIDPTNWGEINIHFDSYLIDYRYAGILQIGEITRTMTSEPEEVIKTFNIDLSGYKMLQPGDILDLSDPEDVLSLLYFRMLIEHPRTDGHLTFLDETWLTNLLISHDGIIVILPQGKYLPSDFRTLTVTLPYEDLGPSLLIRQEAPMRPTPTPTPTPSPTPTPTPTPTPPPTDDGNGDEDGDEDGDIDDGSGDNDDSNTEEEDDDMPDLIDIVPPQGNTIDPSLPMIAISFDDGPGIYTMAFLDLLEQYNVRASFFVIGNLVNTQTGALQRIGEIGSEVMGHSWDHKNLAKMSEENVRKQLESTQNAIEEVTGKTIPMIRPPYGETSGIMKSVAEEMGLAIINWNVDPEDWKNHNADMVYNAVMAQVKDRAIILSHEIYKSTLDAYARLIPELLSIGYQIVTVSELMYFTHGQLTPGEIYYSG